MNFHLTLFWNGTRVMDAKATMVVAHDTALAFVRDQFVMGLNHRTWLAGAFYNVDAPFGLDKLQMMATGAIDRGSYEDRTGRADFTIERIA